MCYTVLMQQEHRKSISKEQWDRAAEAYELGFKNGVEIAAELGVSPSMVSREFKRRGCRKGCRAMTTVAALEAELDAKACRRMAQQKAREQAALRRSAALDKLMDEMVGALVAADQAGNLSLAATKIKEVGRSLGVKRLQ